MGLIETIAALFRRKPAVQPMLPPTPVVVVPPMPPVARVFALTADMLVDGVGVSATTAAVWIGPLRSACAGFEINTAARAAAFLAQIAHESGRFVWTKELWGPTDAQKAYEPPGEKAEDLGNTQVGDGLRFCGRGLIQITGRANYADCSKALGVDFVASPASLEQPVYAALSAAWYWSSRGLNQLADTGDFVTMTKRINGGTNGLADRQALWATCKHAMGVL